VASLFDKILAFHACLGQKKTIVMRQTGANLAAID
jgi:hypothetical protein